MNQPTAATALYRKKTEYYPNSSYIMGVTIVDMKAPAIPHAAENPFTVDRTSAEKSSEGITKVVVVAPKRLIARRKITIVNLSTESRVVSSFQIMATIHKERAFNAKPQSCKSCRVKCK